MWLLKQQGNSSVIISRLELDSEVCETVCKCKFGSSFQERSLQLGSGPITAKLETKVNWNGASE